MRIDNRWFVLAAAAASAAAGVVVGATLRRRHHKVTRELERSKALKSWENEGGNLAPPPVTPELQ